MTSDIFWNVMISSLFYVKMKVKRQHQSLQLNSVRTEPITQLIDSGVISSVRMELSSLVLGPRGFCVVLRVRVKYF